jgi:membrane protein involved in D-alanine export
MTPYENFSFFIWMLVPLVPAILLGFLEISGRVRYLWLIFSTLFMLGVIYRPLSALYQVTGFFLWAYLIVYFFLRFKQGERGKQAETLKRNYYFALMAALLPLVLVKLNPYASALGVWQSPIGFLGISWVTFRTVGTVIEVRDGLIKDVKFFDFLAYVLFFPTLASGPIDRFRRFLGDLDQKLTRKEYGENLAEGVDHIARGFLYKFILAYMINKHGLIPLSNDLTWMATLKYMYVYSFYLFFDFAGYSSFAVGVSYILGIRTPENFNKPFLAKNIKDFWNRWNISLSHWFRDYIYMRFVLDSAKKKRFKSKYAASYIGFILLFGLQGLWHGTELHYIVYGFYHAFLMIGYDWLERKNKSLHFWGKGRAWDGLAILVTAHFVFFGLLIFSGRLF